MSFVFFSFFFATLHQNGYILNNLSSSFRLIPPLLLTYDTTHSHEYCIQNFWRDVSSLPLAFEAEVTAEEQAEEEEERAAVAAEALATQSAARADQNARRREERRRRKEAAERAAMEEMEKTFAAEEERSREAEVGAFHFVYSPYSLD